VRIGPGLDGEHWNYEALPVNRDNQAAAPDGRQADAGLGLDQSCVCRRGGLGAHVF
jgi:hypothetical protein